MQTLRRLLYFAVHRKMSRYSQFPPKSRRTRALSIGGVAVGVVLARAHLPAVATKGVDGAGPVAVVAIVAGLAYAGAAPGMTSTEMRNGF